MDIEKRFTEQRPWGEFRKFIENENSTVKIITVKKDEEFSLQTHSKRSEFWKILSGTGEVTIGEEVIKASRGDEFMIPKETKHRLHATESDVEFLEIAMGEFNENDIIRIEDKYGRN
jgi:mannose-6-phosphate isomerase